MTRPEIHALVDIVMDARERLPRKKLWIDINTNVLFYDMNEKSISSSDFRKFSDFTKAVQEYIKTLE